jgi:Family of unknown function (DUF6282)
VRLANTDHATPTAQRAVTSYKARHLYNPGVIFPPEIPDVTDAIDLHCHCHEGQQDALALAKVASQSGMLGIVFKTIGLRKAYRPAQDVTVIGNALNTWAAAGDVRPIQCWAGYVIGTTSREPSLVELREQLEAGVKAVWLPVNNHANSYFKVGARSRVVDPGSTVHGHTDPLPWDEALKYGLYMLGDDGKLKPEYAEAIRLVADYNATLFFGHATHREIDQIVDLLERLEFKRGVIDHPFSPFVDLSTEMMRDLSRAHITFNFTFDELSPLLGVDPYEMWATIREVGVEHCTLSSDAGEPLFPHTVECIRLIRGYMRAFGASDDDIHRLSTVNPARVLGFAR